MSYIWKYNANKFQCKVQTSQKMQDFMQYVYTVFENYFQAMSVLSFGLDLGPVGCEEKGERGEKELSPKAYS